jgi:hypothetical protein
MKDGFGFGECKRMKGTFGLLSEVEKRGRKAAQ